MTTPTNWPDPARPGYPMFPDRNGEHKINYHDEDFLAAWIAEEGIWFIYDLDNCYTPKEAEERFTYYHGPVLTPAQIAKMLTEERERCAKLCENAYEKSGHDFEYLGCIDVAEEIRNLGDAP